MIYIVHGFWPENENFDFGKRMISCMCMCMHVCLFRYLSMKGESYFATPPPLQTEESRVVLHFHYTQWPDFGVPQAADIFLEFLYAVRSSGVLGSDVGPSVVHCSAGIGRSGTFCLADVCLAKVCRLSLRLSLSLSLC